MLIIIDDLCRLTNKRCVLRQILLEFYAIEFCHSTMKTSNSEILGTKGQAPDVIYENVWLFESTYRASRTCVKNKNSKYLILDHGYFWVLKITLDSSKIIILISSRTINFCYLERDINIYFNEAEISNFPFHKSTCISVSQHDEYHKFNLKSN